MKLSCVFISSENEKWEDFLENLRQIIPLSQ